MLRSNANYSLTLICRQATRAANNLAIVSLFQFNPIFFILFLIVLQTLLLMK